MRSIQDAELLVKGYEIKLSQEEAVPADLSALESHRSTLRVGCSEFLRRLTSYRGKAKVGLQLYVKDRVSTCIIIY